MKLMCKSKMIRYMLVVMLALLPNVVWGLTEKTSVSIANGTSVTFGSLGTYLTKNDYSAWYVYDASGSAVDVSGWTVNNGLGTCENKGTYFLASKPSWGVEDWRTFVITANVDLSNYTIVMLVSSSDEFNNNPIEANAEKKITFKIVSPNEVPLLNDYAGSQVLSVTDFVADGSTSYTLNTLSSSIESFLSLPSSTDALSFDLSSKKLYMRIQLKNRQTGEVQKAADYSVSRGSIKIESSAMSNWPYTDCKTDKGVFYYSNANSSVTKTDLKYTLTVPDGSVITDYNVEVYLSDGEANLSGNTLLQEPELKAKLVYAILAESVKDQVTFTSTDDSSVDASKTFDFRQAFISKTANVKLLTEENKARILSAFELDDLSKIKDLYVRWKITDKKGDAISGITSYSLTLRKDATTGKEVFYTWYSDNAANTLAAALNPTFVFPSTLDWSDLVVSCVLSKTPLVEDTNVKYGLVMKEPDNFDVKFNVSLEEAPILNDLDAAYQDNKNEKNVYLSSATIKQNAFAFSDIASQIEKFNIFSKDGNGAFVATNEKPFYMRISIYDKTTNEIVRPQNFLYNNGQITSNSFQWGNSYVNSKGLYVKLTSNVRPADLNYTIAFASSQNMANYRLEVSISDENPFMEENLIVTEPTIKGKLVYELYDALAAPFKHYKGYANADGDFEIIDASKNQMRQKVAKWEYTYVVDDKAPDNQVSLLLPFEDYEDRGHALEPLGYFRWYDYDTDEASSCLTKEGGEASLLNTVYDVDNHNKGLLAYNVPTGTQANHNSIGVIFTRPTDVDWKGETIACDVSRYVDGMDETGSYLEHECTLSMRFIFHVIPASQLADQMQDNLTNDANDLTYEDGKNVTVGLKDDMAVMTLRLNLVDPKMYYFHPMTNAKKHVYYPDTEKSTRRIESSDFSESIVKPTQVLWRAYAPNKDKYADLGKGNVKDFPRFYDVSLKTLNNAKWKDLDGNEVSDKQTFTWGDYFYIVAFVADEEGNSTPIANFNCRVFNYYPKRLSEMGNEDVTRRVSYLDANYTNVATISFDDDSPELTLSKPTNGMDNQSQHPSDWDKRSYGFVYKDLIEKSAGGANADIYYNPKHSPLHGEYGIYKTANVDGCSGNKNEGYKWYLDNTEIYDRTYETSGHSQYGSFLYVDASDESRTIATASFTADLCTGQQMAFSAGVNSVTSNATTEPQLMFKLFGINKDESGKEKSRKLLHSFSSGDFTGNVNGLQRGEWYQVFGKVTLQREAGVENFTDFRIEIDNYSKGTLGADYCVDDIRIYVKPAKVEVYQDRPACGDSETGNIKLKIRAIHETLNALLGHKDTKIHFRFVQEDGTPLEQEGLYNYSLDGVLQKMPKGYASVDVYDSEEKCLTHNIDGVSMIETDADGERYIVLGNHNFPLKKGKKYYVSVCTDANPSAADAVWGNPADVCSIYSDWFELIGQMPFISDADGNVISDYRVNCSDDNYEVKLTGNLTTVDPKTGEKVTLTGIKYLWYLDGKGDGACLNLDAPSVDITIPAAKIALGLHTIYMKPVSDDKNADGETVYTINGVSYLLCDEAIPVTLRVLKNGPQLNFGFNDVDYPFKDGDYEASLRIGLPQVKALKDKSGYLQVPLHSADYLNSSSDKTLSFVDDTKSDAAASSADVYVATTNDPLWKAKGATLLTAPVATLQSNSIGEIVSGTQSTLGLKFTDNALNNFHEGYWYELRFVFEQRTADATTTNCPGEAYLKLKIVPEFVTWRPTANGGMNANWNNDANWHRSSSAELYDDDYIDYQAYVSGESSKANAKAVEIPTIDNYVPMKFTKVTIDNLFGLPFPDLGNVVYRQSNGIATKLTNGKGNEASKYIQYDIMAYWDEAATNKGFDNNDLKCEKFYGNTCHQIYFKPQGELRDQCYLVYDKAWVEKELKPNTWYTMASPLQYIYAGDMYVPASNGRQETKAFTGISFSDTDAKDGSTVGKALYSRSLYPVYQRAWMKSDVKQVAADQEYDASHYPSGTVADNVEVNLGYWSHIYNKVDESYAADGTFGGFAIKAGNLLLPKDKTNNSLLRLPKEDTSYSYYEYDGKVLTTQTAVGKSAGHGKLLVAYNNSENHLAPMSQTLGSDNTSGFYLVANPYTCSLSLKKFFEANEGLQKAVWLVEESKVKSVSESDLADKDFAIQPMQSFFVKKVTSSDATTGDASSEVSEVKFTSRMYVDRTITAGLQMASDYIKNVNLTARDSKGNVSQARISLRPEASASYDEQEDVDLLCDENLMDIPQVYTVADNEAVAVNAVPSIYWIPLGLVSDEAQEVTLSIQGLAKLDAPIYLYDAETASFTELHDGEPVAMMAGKYGRYFLTPNRTTTDIERVKAEAKKRMVKFYSTTAGRVVVTELGAEKHGEQPAYTLEGKKISVR